GGRSLRAVAIGLALLSAVASESAAGLPSSLSDQIAVAFSGSQDPRWQADMFKKWQGMKDRNSAQIKAKGPACQPARASGIGDCILPEWARFVTALKGANDAKKLNATNLEMNRRAYIQDPVNWGLPDYWATPVEFFQRKGDCEDFATSKFFTLLYAGLRNDTMKVVIVNDLNLGIAHAVFAVDTEDGIMILDNQVMAVVPADRIYHYRAIYAVDLTGAWVFR
ncbi:MAG: hypothetical protein HOH66_00445, partial [Rhodospirillaceae bacterium]|nr:hypothetical protein [Rhodospirillaceae bacterium]